MFQIFKFLFIAVAGWESALILWDTGGPEVMVTDDYNLEQMRLGLVLGSLALATFAYIVELSHRES